MSDGFVIESVRVVNFGGLAERAWEPGSARLSVIVGENGVGKSTLVVDGPCFALYGEVPGGYSPDQLVRIGATDMSVTVEFTLEGARHRAIRRRTTRAGGKTSADLAVQLPDGTWKPEASGPREVTAEITRLLRMDHDIFRTVVVLAQTDAKRFMKATPGKGKPGEPGRATILSTIVVDPRFALVEVRAREEARDLEAKGEADRSHLERTSDAIAELDYAAEVKARREAEIAALEEKGADDKARRAEITERLTALAGEIAKGDAAAAEVARLEEERAALADRYRREKATITASAAAIAAADRTLELATAVEIAAGSIESAKAEVTSLEAAEAQDRALGQQIVEKRRQVTELERPHEAAHATWKADLATARRRVTELTEAANALEPVICEKCQHPNVVDQADVRGQARAARTRAAELEKGEPAVPMAIAREQAALVRLESKQRELGWDEGITIIAAARSYLADQERTAARAGEIEAARTARETATAAKASATAELVAIEQTGHLLAGRIRMATEATAGTQALLDEQTTLKAEALTVDARIDVVERDRRVAEAALARAVASLERQAQLQAERDALVAGLAAADVDLARLRRVIADAGVKGIPARVVEGVLPEFVAHANELLGQLRPAMTVDLRATRAKADGSGTIEALDIWIRDGKGERQRWSGGEETSIAIALASGLNRLGARRSGARVATSIIDEPDGLDGPSRRAFSQALRVLAHRGDLRRVAVITHQDGIPDFADEVLDLDEPAEAPASAAAA